MHMINTKQDKRVTDTPPKKRLGFGYFIAAIIFLANPCLNIVDILPDFFGYIFLLKGLEKWADLCPNIRDAVQGVAKLRWFMLLKMLAVVLSRRPSGLRKTINFYNSLAHRTTWLRTTWTFVPTYEMQYRALRSSAGLCF